MRIEIRPFSPEWTGAVDAFNARLTTGGVESGLRLPLDPEKDLLLGSLMYIATENGAVRGGYILRSQQFSFAGKLRRVAHYRLPLSEGVVDRAYVQVGSLLLRNAVRQEPLLYALGMGSLERPLPRMLKMYGWNLCSVPFCFRVPRPLRFFRELTAARTSTWRTAGMDLAAFSGAGWICLKALEWFRTQRPRSDIQSDEVNDFAGWADAFWRASSSEYGMTAVRDAAMLRELYPPVDERFLRLRVRGAGWAILLDTIMHGDKYFGNLRVGTIVDCLAKPDHADTVIRAARVYLEQRGVDLIVTNQRHAAWLAALRADGFLQAPSNFFFGASKPLSELAGSVAGHHLTRGDGDGPIHL